MKKFIYISALFILFTNGLKSQDELQLDYMYPKSYTIGGITVSGTEFVDQSALILLSELKTGQIIHVPGEDLSKAIENLWSQNLFSDIKIRQEKIVDNVIYLNIWVKEQKRLSRFKFTGISKTEADNIREEIDLYRERLITENLLQSTKNAIINYFVDKGFLNCAVDIQRENDDHYANHQMLIIDVDRKKKVRIQNINIHNNEVFSDVSLKMAMKETKERKMFKPLRGFHTFFPAFLKSLVTSKGPKTENLVIDYFGRNAKVNIFKTSKYLDYNYKTDKAAIISKYNSKGYRDASISQDSVYQIGRNLHIDLTVEEGHQYFFRNITWAGNSKYSNATLSSILSIKKGDIYNQSVLDARLYMSEAGLDISSLYMDDGYLFFQITPVEILVENDSIDIEMRVREGDQARINRVTLVGNTKTNDHVIMREIRTKPGQLFSRSDIIRTQRELAQLGYFDPEKLNVTPKPNPSNGTVDIEYIVEERPTDQVQLSGGWGGGTIVGTLGLTFTNFAIRNFFKAGAWTPVPVGDGQKLSISAQSNGTWFQSYNFSFTEPWLGGKKPNSLTFSLSHSIQTNGVSKYLKDNNGKKVFDSQGDRVLNQNRESLKISGITLGLGTRLKWPDDFFTLYHQLTYQQYEMDNFSRFIFKEGFSNNLYYKASLSRNSVDQPIYPRRGSNLTASLQITAPYSLFQPNVDFVNAEDRVKYKWAEYYKWKVTGEWYDELLTKLVVRTKVGFGFLGHYNNDIGTSPFERFYLGGSGLSGFNFDGREIIALRGYDDQGVFPANPGRVGQSIISKYSMEVRYPISLNPSATIFMLGFMEAGNVWNDVSKYNPFDVKRSAGFGIRIFLPMFGLMGLDWGYRLDDVPAVPGMDRSQIHFTIGGNLGQL